MHMHYCKTILNLVFIANVSRMEVSFSIVVY